MITEFCMHCGAKFQFSLKKPNFCSSCGGSLDGEVSKASQSKSVEIEEKQKETNLLNISKLEYVITSNSNKNTFGDLISQASQSQGEYQRQPDRQAPTEQPSEDIVQSMMGQCKSSREPKDVGGQEP